MPLGSISSDPVTPQRPTAAQPRAESPLHEIVTAPVIVTFTWRDRCRDLTAGAATAPTGADPASSPSAPTSSPLLRKLPTVADHRGLARSCQQPPRPLPRAHAAAAVD